MNAWIGFLAATTLLVCAACTTRSQAPTAAPSPAPSVATPAQIAAAMAAKAKPSPTPEGRAEADALGKDLKGATDAAVAWFSMVDTGHLPEAWAVCSPILKSRTPQKPFIEALLKTRAFVGKLEKRRLNRIRRTATLSNAPNGIYVVIEYGSKFAKKPSAKETLILARDLKGVWRPVGYFVK